MDEERFAALLPYICVDLAALIGERQGVGEEEALEKLYASQLYALLEQEDTKVWHYSTPMLYSLWLQGEQTGRTEFPDV